MNHSFYLNVAHLRNMNYRLLVNSKFSNHLSQCAYSVRKNNNAKLNNKKKITIRHKLRIIKYDVLKFIFR